MAKSNTTQIKKHSTVCEKIVSIKPVGKRQTYDFMVPGTNCYFANGILCHNSGSLEEHSDTVVLMYWPYNNEKQCSDPERFELLVEKQRHGPIGRIELNFLPQYYKFTDRSGLPMPPKMLEGMG